MNKLVVLVILVLFTGCVTQKKCSEKFPLKPEIVTKDSIVIKDTIIYRDRIVPYPIPGDTVFSEKKIPVTVDISPVWAQNDYASASAWVQDSKLKLQLIQKEQVLKIILDSAYKETKFWKEKYTNEKQTVVVEKIVTPKIYKQALSICIFIFAAILLFFGWKAYKFFKP